MNSVKMVDIDSLKPAKFNPKGRTEKHRMKDLVHSMREHGFIVAFPIVANDKGVIADGHRRWTAAKEVGIQKVPVLYLNGSGMTVDEVWSMNALAQSPTSKEVTEAYLSGLKKVPEKYAAQLKYVEEVAGGKEELAELFNERSFAPAVMSRVSRLVEYVGDDSLEFLRETFRWMVKHQVQHISMMAVKYHVEPKVIVAAIKADRPLALLIDAA